MTIQKGECWFMTSNKIKFEVNGRIPFEKVCAKCVAQQLSKQKQQQKPEINYLLMF